MLDDLGNVKSIVETLDENSVQTQNEPVQPETKNNDIQALEKEFYTTMSEYTTNYQLLTQETIENTELQTQSKPYYGKTITIDNKEFSYINPFGYKHAYATNNSWDTRNGTCVGKKPPCPAVCNTCSSGFVQHLPKDAITIQSNDGSYFSVLKDNTLQFGSPSLTGGDCPPICTKTQQGGATDGGKQLNAKNICTNYSSLLGYCGNGEGYTTGTDCRGCAIPPTLYRIPVDITAGTFKISTAENNYINVDNNGIMSISPTFKSETQELTFIFKLVPIADSNGDQYALQVFGDKYLSVQSDGTTQLDTVQHDWNTFTIKGLTNIPPAGGVALVNNQCTEYCSSKGFCGKGAPYTLGGADCAGCNKLDDNVITVSQPQYNTIGRASKDMNDSQPCGIAGQLIKNTTTKELAWVDTASVKHPFLKGAWDKKHKTCTSNNILNLSSDDYNNIPSGDPMTSATTCRRTYAAEDLERTLDTQYKKLHSLANQIISETKSVDGENRAAKQQLSQTRDKFNTIINNVSKDHETWSVKQKIGITVAASEESSGLFANSNELHLYMWIVVVIGIILYIINLVGGERTTIYDANVLTLFNKQNVILLIAIIWLVVSGWKSRPKWLRRDWYTLPAWLR